MDRAVVKQDQSNETIDSTQLVEENERLKVRLNFLIEQAQRNQMIMERLQNFDLTIIGTNSFRELIQHVFTSLVQTSELDSVTLILLDPREELRDMLTDLKVDLSAYPHLSFVRHLRDVHMVAYEKPLLGSYHVRIHGKLFGSVLEKPESVAVIPLWRQDRLLGLLNLGSNNLQRFQSNMATDFIERLGSVIAVCLENVINSERLTYIGLTDPLTHVANRRFVELKILEEIERGRRQQYGIAAMYLDIDFFKSVNDQYGHQAGDEVLRETANRIKAELRLSDTIGRFGGEEFVVVLVNTQLQDALVVAERIRKSICSKPFTLNEHQSIHSSISIGVTSLTEIQNIGDVNTLSRQLLASADKALYDAKNSGRNRVCNAEFLVE